MQCQCIRSQIVTLQADNFKLQIFRASELSAQCGGRVRLPTSRHFRIQEQGVCTAFESIVSCSHHSPRRPLWLSRTPVMSTPTVVPSMMSTGISSISSVVRNDLILFLPSLIAFPRSSPVTRSGLKSYCQLYWLWSQAAASL